MKDGFYWMKREGFDLQVVEILEDEMYVCGSDVSGSLVEGKWIFFDDPIDIDYIEGPIDHHKHGYGDDSSNAILPPIPDVDVLTASKLDDPIHAGEYFSYYTLVKFAIDAISLNAKHK